MRCWQERRTPSRWRCSVDAPVSCRSRRCSARRTVSTAVVMSRITWKRSKTMRCAPSADLRASPACTDPTCPSRPPPPRPLVVGERRIERRQALHAAAFADVFDRRPLEIADDRVIHVASPKRFFVHPEVAQRAGPTAHLPAPDRTLHQAPGFIPTDAQQPTRAAERAALQDASITSRSINIVKRARGSAHGTRTCLTPCRTLHPWDARVQRRFELAGIEVTPSPLLGVIEARQRRRTLATRPRPRVMLGPEVDALLRLVEYHAGDVPGRLQAEDRFKELCILHPPLVPVTTDSAMRPPSRPPTKCGARAGGRCSLNHPR